MIYDYSCKIIILFYLFIIIFIYVKQTTTIILEPKEYKLTLKVIL